MPASGESPEKEESVSNLPRDYISALAGHTAPVPGESPFERPIARRRSRSSTGKKIRVTAYLSPKLRDRAMNAVAYLSSRGRRWTLSGLTRSALEQEVERLEKEHNSGRPFLESESSVQNRPECPAAY